MLITLIVYTFLQKIQYLFSFAFLYHIFIGSFIAIASEIITIIFLKIYLNTMQGSQKAIFNPVVGTSYKILSVVDAKKALTVGGSFQLRLEDFK